jgi:hypothetical protein
MNETQLRTMCESKYPNIYSLVKYDEATGRYSDGVAQGIYEHWKAFYLLILPEIEGVKTTNQSLRDVMNMQTEFINKLEASVVTQTNYADKLEGVVFAQTELITKLEDKSVERQKIISGIINTSPKQSLSLGGDLGFITVLSVTQSALEKLNE